MQKNAKWIQGWALDNPWSCILIGVSIIEIGQITDLFYEKNPNFLLFTFSHLFVILGEVIVVTFFLHLHVEEKQHKDNAKMLESVSDANKHILEKQAEVIGNEFKTLVLDLKKHADITIRNINDDLFEAILKEKLPHQIVRAVLDSNFLNAELLRKNYEITFFIKGITDNEVEIRQRIEFDMEYIFGSKLEYSYDMPITLTNTPLAKYSLKSLGYRSYAGEKEWISYDLNHGITKVGDRYILNQPVMITKNNKIKVYQEIEAGYLLGNDGMVDSLYAKYHTLDSRINIVDLPDDYEFIAYPTFPSNRFNHPTKTGTKISYKHIEFMVPGQGFGFSISKKDK